MILRIWQYRETKVPSDRQQEASVAKKVRAGRKDAKPTLESEQQTRQRSIRYNLEYKINTRDSMWI